MANRLKLADFNADGDPLVELPGKQAIYLRHYLADQQAASVLIEPAYFDRDYLSEFAAFYGVSSRGYSNRCLRCHYFSVPITRNQLRAAAGGSVRAAKRLQDAYLGFLVVRPIPAARLGRAVLKWYPDPTPQTPRVIEPSRWYTCHVAGITLSVEGLAWQQQDTGVGACATIALWSMLHSSAFDDHHAIPTTADITRFAHQTTPSTSRMFPSTGLNIQQVCEAIKEAGLAPVVLQGDVKHPQHPDRRVFSPGRFRAATASLLRSGYPILILGDLDDRENGRHAVCGVGFREGAAPVPGPGTIELQDATIPHLYIHDDNIGPSVKFGILTDTTTPKTPFVRLKPVAPPPKHKLKLPPDPTAKYPGLVPSQIVTAVHEDLRTSPDRLHATALRVARALRDAYQRLDEQGLIEDDGVGLTVGTRFMKMHEYVDQELGRLLAGAPATRSRVRLALWEQVAPMSLHLGIVRIGWKATPLVDVLYDTTDSNKHLWPFAQVRMSHQVGQILDWLTANTNLNFGTPVEAW